MLRRARLGCWWEETVDSVAFDWQAAGLLTTMLAARACNSTQPLSSNGYSRKDMGVF